MSVRIACPACARPLKVAENLLGRMITCPKCKERVRVPSGEPGVVIERAQPQHQAYRILCAGCGKTLTVDETIVDLPLQCDACETPIVIDAYEPLVRLRDEILARRQAAKEAKRSAEREAKEAKRAQRAAEKEQAKAAKQAAREDADRNRAKAEAEAAASLPIAQPAAGTAPAEYASAPVAPPPRRPKGKGLAALRNARLGDEEQTAFKQELRRRKKSLLVAYFAWFILGWHYAYVGQWGLQVLYWVTFGGFGFWVFIDIFRMPGIVRRYNDAIADTITTQIAALR